MIINQTLQTHFDSLYEQPTAIQKVVFEKLTAGDSLFGLAPTGSGKTLAFALPILNRVTAQQQTQYLILAPSQELAAQLTQVIRPWASLVNASVLSLIGGANGRRQADKLKKDHPQIVVGTLGRTLTMLESGALKTKHLQGLIIDEADELILPERAEDLTKLSQYLPEQIQLGLFSATSGVDLKWVQELFGQTVSPVSVGQTVPRTIEHTYQYVDAKVQIKVLVQLARHHQQALVFFNTIGALVTAQSALKHANVKVMSIGNNEKSQIKRADAMRLFKKGQIDLLLATDVAARGLDIIDLPLVVNAQLPSRKKTYIHRTGRTGRAGKPGMILNFGNDHDIRNLKKELGDDFDLVPFEGLPEQATKQVVPKVHKDPKQTAKGVQSKSGTETKEQNQTKSKKAKDIDSNVSKPLITQPAKSKKKKNRQRNKDKGKPKWAQKSK